MINDFRKTQIKKKIKNGHFSFFCWHFATTVPHTVISNSEKFTYPIIHTVYSKAWKTSAKRYGTGIELTKIAAQ